MEDSGVFTQLSSRLTQNERKALLEKLQSQSNISRDPLYSENNRDAPTNELEHQFQKLPWYAHIWLVILGVIKAKSPFKMFQEREMAKMGKVIEAEAPGYYDYSKDLLLPEFHRQLGALRDAARFFYTALDASVNRDRGGFYSFLGSLEMENIHTQLLIETNPVHIIETEPDISNQDLRQRSFQIMEEAISHTTEAQKNVMYSNARSLFCLKQLSTFLYDRILMAFNEKAGTTCSALLVKDQLSTLANILFSFKEIPSMALLQSLFIFLLQEHEADPGFDLNTETHNLLARAEGAITIIREFNKQVPLLQILRCASKNPSLMPRELSGGEDWFLVYREQWRQYVENQLSEYLRTRHYHDLLNAFKYFLKGTNIELLENTFSESNPGGIHVKGAFSLSFLQTFYRVVFMTDVYKILRPILIDGEFLRRENRLEFTEYYNELITLEDTIKRFEEAISPLGDFGKRYTLAREEMSSLPIKRRKIQMITEEASEDALQISEHAVAAILGMANVLRGILKIDAGGRYDTLANLPQLAGRGTAFLDGLKDSLSQLEKALQILSDIDVMEAEL